MVNAMRLAIVAILLSSAPNAHAADGKALYETTCIACHGRKAEGSIPGVPDLANAVHMSKSDSELVANIMNGYQTKGSPMAMPPKGGNPVLTAEDAHSIVGYLRTLARKAE